ncbi:MAG: AbrB/MazE/SpoVT family DNA-binding domain-containing protein [Eubacteriales bacterium]|nr:AbrB/MazE/SpoVT family DNA-binding domain-containing protein [Eubacteriales bacterium]
MIPINTEVTALSSKGQVVLPKTIRDSLELSAGSKFLIFSDGQNILLKPIRQPDIREFDSLMDAAASWAASVGMEESEIMEAVKAVRKNRKARA